MDRDTQAYLKSLCEAQQMVSPNANNPDIANKYIALGGGVAGWDGQGNFPHTTVPAGQSGDTNAVDSSIVSNIVSKLTNPDNDGISKPEDKPADGKTVSESDKVTSAFDKLLESDEECPECIQKIYEQLGVSPLEMLESINEDITTETKTTKTEFSQAVNEAVDLSEHGSKMIKRLLKEMDEQEKEISTSLELDDLNDDDDDADVQLVNAFDIDADDEGSED